MFVVVLVCCGRPDGPINNSRAFLSVATEPGVHERDSPNTPTQSNLARRLHPLLLLLHHHFHLSFYSSSSSCASSASSFQKERESALARV